MITRDQICIVDEIADTGKALLPYREAGFFIATLLQRPNSIVTANICPNIKDKNDHRWTIFPWETRKYPVDKYFYYPWEQFDADMKKIADTIKALEKNFQYVYGVPRGGLVPAVALTHLLWPDETGYSDKTRGRLLITLPEDIDPLRRTS